MYRRFYLLVICCLAIMPTAMAQHKEWEDITINGLTWKPDLKLAWYSTSLTQLKVGNLTPETKEDKKNNRWKSYNVGLNYQIKNDRPFRVSVKVTNLNDNPNYKYAVYNGKKQKWHSSSIYWGYEVGVILCAG